MPQVHTRNLEGQWNHDRAAKIKMAGWLLFWLGMAAAGIALMAYMSLTSSLVEMTFQGEKSIETPKVKVSYALVATLGVPGLLAMMSGGLMLLIQKQREEQYAFEQEERLR